jgi:hypothetical protein
MMMIGRTLPETGHDFVVPAASEHRLRRCGQRHRDERDVERGEGTMVVRDGKAGTGGRAPGKKSTNRVIGGRRDARDRDGS